MLATELMLKLRRGGAESGYPPLRMLPLSSRFSLLAPCLTARGVFFPEQVEVMTGCREKKDPSMYHPYNDYTYTNYQRLTDTVFIHVSVILFFWFNKYKFLMICRTLILSIVCRILERPNTF